MARSSDDSEDEDFVVLGTALPELDESDVTSKKPTTVQDLTAKDREGRRRFHGAFTGGFSAGYFNTVGSKEGFTPTSFVSSRSQKHEDAQTLRPEDFMDDEDVGEHGIAPRKFATAGSYTSEERKRKFDEDLSKRMTQSSALNLGDALSDLVIPEYLPIGIKLLRKMGWREGQGLGPRVRKKKKKTTEKKKGDAGGKKIYGCALPSSGSDSEDSDSFVPADFSDLTFAPTDVTPICLSAKDDVKGLGYRGLDPTLALPSTHVNLFGNPVRGKKTGKGIKGHAFGVGALEDDDDDIFAQDSMANYDMTMRDEDDDEKDSNFGWTAPRSHGKQKVPVSYVGKLLEGFCLSSKPLKPGKKFPPPTLPPNFKPFHWSRRRKKEEASTGGKANQMTAVDRGLMLGETPIMSSVFDLVSGQGRSQMDSAKEAIEMTRSLEASTTLTPSSTRNEKTESNSDSVSRTANQPSKFLSRFTPASSDDNSSKVDASSHKVNTPLFQGSINVQPFRKDPAKQSRYDTYLASVKKGLSDPYSEVSSSSLTEWEKAREKEEFSRSAKLFRPMSAMMSSRFVQGAMMDDTNEEVKPSEKEAASDEAKAAEMKMFGKLTREEFEWHPDKLLCRRFNVPNPYPGSDIVGLPNVKRDKYSIFNFLTIGDFQPKDQTEDSKADSKESSRPSGKELHAKGPEKKKATLSSIFKVLDDPDFHKPAKETKARIPETEKDEVDEEKEEEAESEPDVDLFRAIFKNSDSEDSEEEKPANDFDKSSDENGGKSDDENVNMVESIQNESSVISTSNPVQDMDVSDVQGLSDSKADGDSEPQNYSVDVKREEDTNTPLKLSAEPASSNPFSSVFQDPGVKSRRSGSRWGPKSIFSVLDDVNDDAKSEKRTQITEDAEDAYGPALPPALESSSQTPEPVHGVTSSFHPKGAKQEETESHVHRHRNHRDKHKHKKEKKKKSKHKKEKKNKRSKKSSKSKKAKTESSGSEADTESDNDSDASGDELVERLKQVSRMKSGKL